MAEESTYKNLGPTLEIETGAIQRCSYQPRTHFDLTKLKRLAKSIRKVGQKRPGLVRILSSEEVAKLANAESTKKIRFELVDGERRWRACGMVGIAYKAYVIRVKNEADIFQHSAVANFGGEGHTPLEILNALERVKSDLEKETGQECTQEDLADIFAKSQGWVSQYLKLQKLGLLAKQELDPELPEKKRLMFSIVKALPILPHDLQNVAIKHIKENKLRYFAAMQYIRDLVKKHGIEHATRKRSPKSDYRVLLNYLTQTEQKAGGLLNIPHTRFREIFENRKPEELKGLKQSFAACRENLTALEDTIEHATKEFG